MREAGVTLLELLVTLTIVMILASVAMPLSRVSTKRSHEIELRQNLRIMRAAIDTFKTEWNRDGDVLIGPLCVKNKLSCKDVTSIYGYPKSLEMLLGVKLTSEEATVRGTTISSSINVNPDAPARRNSPISVFRSIQRRFLTDSHDVVHVAPAPARRIGRVLITAELPICLTGQWIKGKASKVPPDRRAP